jgi:hypothetical protein
VLSVDAIYSYVSDSVSLALASGVGANDPNGVPIPPFLPQTLTATISDNEAVMVVAKFTAQFPRRKAALVNERLVAASWCSPDVQILARAVLAIT